MHPLPTVVLLCHEDEPLDCEGLARWLASSLRLAGLVVIQDRRSRRWRALARERRRSGWLGLADVLAFRLLYGLTRARQDRTWTAAAIARLAAAHPVDLTGVPRLVVRDPNGADVIQFLRRVSPDVMIARCKRLLKPSVFEIPRAGTLAIHPGICPEYRNAHGCFWALVNRDLARVGMTLLRIDRGVDTGPAFLQAGCAFDEREESHIVIQHRAVLDNLDAIRQAIVEVAERRRDPIGLEGRPSAVWGQPRLSAWWRWRRALEVRP
jgi:folate-dependent phosphoribosylglycinamide formyltransferase PurN